MCANVYPKVSGETKPWQEHTSRKRKKIKKKKRKALNENYTIFKTQGTNEIKFIAFSQTTTKSYVFYIHMYIVIRTFRIN